MYDLKSQYFAMMKMAYKPSPNPTSFELTEDECKSVQTLEDAEELIHTAAKRGSMKANTKFIKESTFDYSEGVGFSLRRGISGSNMDAFKIFTLSKTNGHYLPIPKRVQLNLNFGVTYMQHALILARTNKNTEYQLINLTDSHTYNPSASQTDRLYKDNNTVTVTSWRASSSGFITADVSLDIENESTACFTQNEELTYIDYLCCLKYISYATQPVYIKYMKIDWE